jgi:hypothetical protein
MYKSKKMKKGWMPITLATIYLFFYKLAPFIGIPDEVIIVLLILVTICDNQHGLYYFKVRQAIKIQL